MKVKSVAILDDMNNVINLGDDLGLKPAPNFSTRVLGWNVAQLYVRVELAGEGVPDDKMPAQITVDVRMLEPGRRRIGKSSMMSTCPMTLNRQAKSPLYRSSIPLSRLATFRKPDTTPEVATVVRENGTSDKKFRKPLVDAGWSLRGVGLQPDKGKWDITGGVKDDQPDALTLFKVGGVEVVEVTVPAGNGLESGGNYRAWAFVQSPADIFFYSGHGLLTNGQLVRGRGFFHDYQDWLSPRDVLDEWGVDGDAVMRRWIWTC